MEIRQLRVGHDNFSYVLHCARTGKAVMVDPSVNASAAMRLIGSLNLELTAVIDTHCHADHTADNLRVKEAYRCGLLASKADAHNIGGLTGFLEDGQIIRVGDARIEVLHTPGHTPGSICLLADAAALLTGDTLFIGDCGRADLPGGDDRQMYASMQRLKGLDPGIVVYPGHDYGSKPFDTLGHQKAVSKVLLARSYEDFSRIK